MSAPVVPQRPTRSQQKPSEEALDPSPRIPPRPQRSGQNGATTPPERDGFARSPLNDSPFAANIPARNSEFYQQDRNSSNPHLPNRPPSVSSLPMIGQEGIEYASLEGTARGDEGHAAELVHRPASPGQTRNVAGDLPLHAPKASLPAQAAAEQVAPVTRTDSRTAASAGIGQAHSEYDEHHQSHHSHQQSHASRHSHNRPPLDGYHRPPSSAHSHRPASSRAESLHGDEEEHGIPTIGLQVPMYPNAGDVQAPSPGQHNASHPPGIGFFNDGRRKSAQAFQNPPGSYGLHGHGVIHQDQFEKSWYQKHPEELAKEAHGAYGPSITGGRGEWALSSEQLNNLVRASSAQDPNLKGTIPSELIGHVAAEAYVSRMASGESSPILPPHIATGEKHLESPLRQTMSAAPPAGSAQPGHSTIHIDDAPQYHTEYGHQTRSGRNSPSVDKFDEPTGASIDRRNARTPILASDEVAKHRYGDSYYPAVSAEHIVSDETHYASILNNRAAGLHRPGSGGSRSRPNSRPNSIHNLSRFSTHEDGAHTPLEEIEEYEPLFADDDPKEKKTETRQFKRPDNLEKHRFPSLDIWEDTPTSLQLETTVEGPQEPLEKELAEAAAPSSAFESPDAEAARKGGITEAQRVQAAKQRQAAVKLSSALGQEVRPRPGMQPRFPSLDVWEDTPDSLSLTTTVNPISPEGPTAESSSIDAFSKSPPDSKPSVPARPAQRVTRPVDLPPPATKSKETSPVEKKQAPLIPDRPKPQVPARPTRPVAHPDTTPPTGSPLTKSISAGSASGNDESANVAKPRPSVPTRPGGTSKVAQMRAGFMNDLNSRLQLGPQVVRAQPSSEVAEDKEKEIVEEEKTPLADARKGRARGPTRRKPASSPEKEEAATQATPAPAKPTFSFWTPQSVWQIGSDGGDSVSVFDYAQAADSKLSEGTATTTAADLGEQPDASPLARNTAGDSLISKEEAPETASGVLAHATSASMDDRAAKEEARQGTEVREHLKEQIGSKHDMPEPDASSFAAHTAPSAGIVSNDDRPTADEKMVVSPVKSKQTQPMETVLTDEHLDTEFEKSRENVTQFEPLEKKPTAIEEDGGAD